MPETVAYHVDRTGQLQSGYTIKLQDPPPMPAGGVDLSVEFPGGLSSHGQQYVASAAFDGNVASEWFFELVRRAEFSERTSRFQAVFALPTLADARAFRHSIVGNLTTPIVRVRGQAAHRANMQLIRWTAPAITTLARAQEYWRGDPGLAIPPVWELLLVPPVVVLERVPENEPAERLDMALTP